MIRPSDSGALVYLCVEPVDGRNYAEYSVMCCCEVMLGASRLMLEAGRAWRGIDYCA